MATATVNTKTITQTVTKPVPHTEVRLDLTLEEAAALRTLAAVPSTKIRELFQLYDTLCRVNRELSGFTRGHVVPVRTGDLRLIHYDLDADKVTRLLAASLPTTVT